MKYSSTIGVGGFNFTNDLAIGTRTPIDKAEIIKRKYGMGMDPNLRNQNIEIPSVGGKKMRLINPSLLTEILKPRAEEIFEMIRNKIEQEGLENKINAGVVLTGGTSQLDGLLEVADEIFSTPVRVGKPTGLGGLIDKVNTPDFSTSLGLIKYGLLDMRNRGVMPDSSGGFLQKVREWIGL